VKITNPIIHPDGSLCMAPTRCGFDGLCNNHPRFRGPAAPHPSDSERTLYDRGFEYGANPDRHDHIDGCGHNGEGVEPEFMRGWRAGRAAPSDSERTLRTGLWTCPVCGDRIAADMERQVANHLRIQHGLAAIEAESERVSLDADALLYAVQATNHVLESRTASMTEKRDRLARAYRRLSPSTGTPEPKP